MDPKSNTDNKLNNESYSKSTILIVIVFPILFYERKKGDFIQGVSVTQSGFVMGTVFIATIIFTPLCGKFHANKLNKVIFGREIKDTYGSRSKNAPVR